MISWKVTTYGRVSTLEETLFSFLNQDDLTDCEMVIVNDYSLQELVFDNPQVRIFNFKETFKTIGDKENFVVEQCRGDIIAVTDDDDVYMSNHNTNIKKYFTNGTNILHWKKGVFYNKPNITNIVSIGNSGMVYSKEAWLKVGKHPIMNAGGDSDFAAKVHSLGNVVHASPPDSEISAWYRWGGMGYHQSGMGHDVPGRPNIIERHSRHIEGLRRAGKIPTGVIHLKPKWNQPYDKMLQEFIKKKR